jgi:TetR/AcrR family transcriptional repressor of nem operon
MTIEKSTKVRAIEEARSLLQRQGFNGFSFQHIADALGIKKPSLYDHFESKEELGRDLVADYAQNFTQWTETIEIFGPREKVGALFELFFKFSSKSGKICPLSALTADYNTLPKSLKKPLAKVCLFQLSWLKRVIEEGQQQKIFRRDLTSRELAELVLSVGLGSQLLARAMMEPEGIRKMKEQSLKILEVV